MWSFHLLVNWRVISKQILLRQALFWKPENTVCSSKGKLSLIQADEQAHRPKNRLKVS
jgi:hypothetical protein